MRPLTINLLTGLFVVLGFIASQMYSGTSVQQLLETTKQYLGFIPKAATTVSDRPTGPLANSGLELLAWGTPNGHKVQIYLEELRQAYNLSYTYQPINLGQNIQKEQWFTKLGPNGKIPVLVDHDRGGFAVMEGAAILAYLARRYDPEQRFSFEYDSDDYSTAEQWIAWQHGGLGPMQGQANHFYRLAKERIAYPTHRFVGECERLYGVLDARLEGRDYLVGPGRGKYSIADIANFSWVNVAFFAGVDLKQFKNVYAWSKRINERDAVKKGTSMPSESKVVNPAYEVRIKEEPEFAQKEKELKELADRAKELRL